MKPKVLEQRIPLQRCSGLRCAADVDRDGLALGVFRDTAKSILPTILEDKGDGIHEALASLFFRTTLSVGTGHFRAIGHNPLNVVLEYRCELVAHDSPLRPSETYAEI